jgi:hypothetical protein
MKKLQFLLACPAKSLGVDKIKKNTTPQQISCRIKLFQVLIKSVIFCEMRAKWRQSWRFRRTRLN